MAGRHLKALFRAFNEGDELAFRRAAQAIIEEEEALQHVALARDLRKLLAGPDAVGVPASAILPEPPRDREGEWPLAEARHPSRYLDDLVLAPAAVAKLDQLRREVPAWTMLDQRGIPRRQKLLFYGPPGCGKSTGAEGLAAELGWPLLLVRLDAVVSSYLGETASNLRRIFDFAAANTWLVLFDEFDALARHRDDPTEHGEIKRVITAFLQMLDGFKGASLLIAATNHEGLLDSAVWRRFDDVVHFPRPTVKQLRSVLRSRLRSVPHRGVNLDNIASRLRGLPHAAAERVAWDAQRLAFLAGRDSLAKADLEEAVRSAVSRPW